MKTNVKERHGTSFVLKDVSCFSLAYYDNLAVYPSIRVKIFKTDAF